MSDTDLINETYVELQDLIEAQIALMAIVGDRYGRDFAADNAGLPALTWEFISLAGHSGMDVEAHEYHADSVQFSIWHSDKDAIRVLERYVDAMNDQPLRGTELDSTHWRCTLFRRVSAWRRIDWTERQTPAGGYLIQLTSDWSLRYLRRQNVV